MVNVMMYKELLRWYYNATGRIGDQRYALAPAEETGANSEA